MQNHKPIVVIIGPTGSGKTAAAIDIARRIGGEIIAADSRTVYRGMSIGTAKPTMQERQGVPHFGFDLVSPNERFTAYDFQQYARRCIIDIHRRGKVPIIAGGTGLYVDALILNYTFPSQKAADQQFGAATRLLQPPPQIVVVGIDIDKEILNKRLRDRADTMLEQGVVQETIELRARYSQTCPAMSGNMYQVIGEYLDGKISKAELPEKMAIKDRQLAKRQRTWFRRHDFITWLPQPQVTPYIVSRLGATTKSCYTEIS
jgi:tRNA dimethylallyltransferase